MSPNYLLISDWSMMVPWLSCVADQFVPECGPCAINVHALFLSAVDGPKRGSVLDVLACLTFL